MVIVRRNQPNDSSRDPLVASPRPPEVKVEQGTSGQASAFGGEQEFVQYFQVN